MFIEAAWQDNLIALLAAINAILGVPDHTVPKLPLTVNSIVNIGISLQEDAYQPAQWFDKNSSPSHIVRGMLSATPSIDVNAKYDVLYLPIEFNRPKMVSSRGDGILFEDPFYALLSSFNIGYFKKNWVEVRVSSREQAWMQRAGIVNDIMLGAYHPQQYFNLAGESLATPDEALLSLHSITGEDILRLVDNGTTDVRLDANFGQLLLLYRYVAP